MRVYYNEFDPYAADWLKNLMRDGLIPFGDIDERDIREVHPDDVRNYDQCHFFAGIGGWALAARLTGWDRPLWTGSCPCQPFSVAGKRKGTADQRHLWPEFFRLIEECNPATVVGEQVASKDGREWLSGVFADLEGVGYAVAGADLCAAGLAAPHIRQRLWWAADANPERLAGKHSLLRERQKDLPQVARCSADGRLAFSEGQQCNGSGAAGRGWGEYSDGRGLGDTDHARPQGRRIDAGEYASQRTPWAASVDNWIPCLDGKARRIEPGLEPLVNGLPFKLADGRTVETASRKEILKGLGNAIVPELGALWLSVCSTFSEGVIGERTDTVSS